jgi:hypothetical protein
MIAEATIETHITLFKQFESRETLSAADLNQLQIVFNQYTSDEALSTTWHNLWNSFICELVLNANQPLALKYKQAIVIFKLHFYSLSDNINLESNFKTILRSTPIIPIGIFPLPKLLPANIANTANTETVNSEDYYNNLQTIINNCNATKQELVEIQNRLIQESKRVLAMQTPLFDDNGNEQPNPDNPPLIDFTNLSFSLLTPIALETAVSVGYDATSQKVPFIDLKDELNNKIDESYAKLYDIQAVNKVVYVDGMFSYEVKDNSYYDLSNPNSPFTWNDGGTSCKAKPIGISDYQKVEAVWKKYEPGEIAHIENLLLGELKERTTRHLRSTEDTYTIETIKESEVVRDLQTTERFAIQKEASKIVQEDFEAKIEANVQGSYGMVSFGVTAGASYATNTQTSKAESTQYAKDVIDRSLNRILERTREQRTIRIIEEFEETNKHVLNNVAGTDHVIGIYRWVDKIMQCTLANYGKRLLFEFVVPEPAAFHLFAKSKNTVKGITLQKPNHPSIGIPSKAGGILTLNSADDLDENNYKIFAAAYDASVETYPKAFNLNKAFSTVNPAPDTGKLEAFGGADNSLEIPKGYESVAAAVSGFSTGIASHGRVYINEIKVVDIYFGTYSGTTTYQFQTKIQSVNWGGKSAIPFVFNFNVVISCEPSDTHKSEWKLATYNSIMAAYNKKLDDYNNAFAEAQVSQGINIQGSNPLEYRNIEKNELKKSCIQLLTYDNLFHVNFKVMQHPNPSLPIDENYPYFNNCKAIENGKPINFLESIFDWDIMSYFFHPYFYANRKRWINLYNLDSNDPVHTSFLKAGYARVVVPVRKGFETAAINFSETGQIDFDNLLGISIEAADAVAELEQNNLIATDPNYATSDLNPANWPKWDIRVPTNLVVLQQQAIAVQENGLPINPNV